MMGTPDTKSEAQSEASFPENTWLGCHRHGKSPVIWCSEGLSSGRDNSGTSLNVLTAGEWGRKTAGLFSSFDGRWRFGAHLSCESFVRQGVHSPK